MIDLQKYCGDDPFRPYLHKPFSHGSFTYATNGHIMVRTPRQTGVPEQTQKGGWDTPLKGIDAAKFSPLQHKPLPPTREPTEEECLACEGRGHAHDCPECTCDCKECDGTGNRMAADKTSTKVRGVTFDLRYIAMMLAMPGVEVMVSPQEAEPLLFKFEGGVGAVMPMRAQHPSHVEIEDDKAA